MEHPHQQFVLQNIDEVPDNYVKFIRVTSHISSELYDPSQPLYLGVDHTYEDYRLSKVTIDQIKNNKIKHIAHFYKRYQYTRGLQLLLDNLENINYYKLLLTGEYINEHRMCFYLYFDLFVDKHFILNMYEQSQIPELVFRLMKDGENSFQTDDKILEQYGIEIIRKTKGYASNYTIKNLLKKKDNILKAENKWMNCQMNINNEYYASTSIYSSFKRPLFEYQKQNVNWMRQIEHNIENVKWETVSSRYCGIYQIDSINEKLIFKDETKQMLSPNEPKYSICVKGGILADEIGLGKTFSMIALINEQKKENSQCSLIVTPRRICHQWLSEFEKSCHLNVKIIATISQFKKLNYQNIGDYDVIILSYNFLNNKRYLEYSLENQDKFTLITYLWERVIFDEGHEYFNLSGKKDILEKMGTIRKIQSKYRWLCTGTPCSSPKNLWYLIHYLIDVRINGEQTDLNHQDMYEMFQHIRNDLKNHIIRKNTQKSVKKQVKIPKFSINTEFLVQGTIERAIYDSALGDIDKMIQLCNHILVSDQHINILGNKPLPLDEIYLKMTNYYRKKVERLTTRLNNINSELDSENITSVKEEELKTKKIDIEQDLTNSKCRLNIFGNLPEKLEKEKTCPVCLESLENELKSVAPCGHFVCSKCICNIFRHSKKKNLECPMCRHLFKQSDLQIVNNKQEKEANKLGTKMTRLIKYCQEELIDPTNRMIIFSQWDNMLKLISKILNENEISHLLLNGSMYTLNNKIRKFKLDNSYRIILLSMDKAASGLNLTEANQIVLLDTLNTDMNSSKIIEEQAIGRCVRIGQTKNVKVKRFIMKDTIEEEFYNRNTL